MDGQPTPQPQANFLAKINPSSAIIIAGVIIAIAIIASGGVSRGGTPVGTGGAPAPKADVLKNLRPVTDKDHVFGDLAKAKVFIVEFSDLQCPFCQRFHPTLKQIVADYKGQVAWAYRHLPLESIHPLAFKEAEATECVASLGGNDAFWQYIDLIFEPGFDTANIDAALTKAAVTVGVSESSFKSCLAGGQFKDKIRGDMNEAQAVGATGTPFAVIYNKAGKFDLILGAEPLDSIKGKIDPLLK